MNGISIHALLEKQRVFFQTGATLDIHQRILYLKKLLQWILNHEQDIEEALFADLGKSEYESYMCEVGLVLSELRYFIRNIRKFAAEKRVSTPLSQFPSKSKVLVSPYGNTLIMSPWNYPFLLSVDPLIAAIAAGNTVILKPSAYAPHTAKILEQMVLDCFAFEYVAMVTGGREENQALLQMKFDMIFFTGSQRVGKEVLRQAAEHLTPVVLELGGKSPCIVEKTADLKIAAKRIVFGKFLNCGQTCVAPDYLLVDRSLKSRFLPLLFSEIEKQYGKNPLNNPLYGKIINEKHFDRLVSLISEEKCVFGGKSRKESLKIEPTVFSDCTFDDELMQEELFGPLLPIVYYDEEEEIYPLLKDLPKPLALYLFTENKHLMKTLPVQLSFGGGCINDTVIHLATSKMGFGGVGESGMGSYHGKAGFDAFSHKKSMVFAKNQMDLPMRYPPYIHPFYEKIVRFFLK